MRSFLKIFWPLLLVFAAGVAHAGMTLSPGVGVHDHADANTGGAAVDCAAPCSNRSCAANFTRVAPNLCLRTDAPSLTTAPTSCTSLSLPAAGATSLLIMYDMSLNGLNSVGNFDTATYDIHANSGCTAVRAEVAAGVKEFVAANNVAVVLQQSYLWVPVAGGAVWEIFINAAGAGSFVIRQIRGYTD